MAVVGIDLGTQFTVIAQAVRGGVDIILNESSKRLTPSLVSFVGDERYLGEQATTQVRTNMNNTVNEIKRIIGRKFFEPGVQEDLKKLLNFRAKQLENDEIGIDVNYNGALHTFTPVQILAMLLTEAKHIIQLNNPSAATADVVLSVPAYFTDAQRAAYKDAAHIAGLNCLRLMNDGTAAALSYGIYKSAKKEFPDGKETKVLFLDMGYGHFSATIAGFTNTSLRVVASESDADIGGRELDVALAKYFADDFQQKTGIDAWNDRKARLKLLVAAEKAKITITPHGVNSTQVGVECLKDERDFSLTLTIEKLEELAQPYMARMQSAITRALAAADCTVSDLAAIELVGGGMRPRIVKRRAAEALQLPLNEETGHGLGTSMNLDEAVSRGCALSCAMLSPIFRVKPFDIVDRVEYPIRITWEPVTGGGSGAEANEMDLDEKDDAGAPDASPATMSSDNYRLLFNTGDAVPLTRRITFRRSTSFEIWAEYDGTAKLFAGHPKQLARYLVNIPADLIDGTAEAPKVRVDFRVDMHNQLTLVKAELLKESKEAPAPEAAPAPKPEGAAPEQTPPADAPAAPEATKPATKKFKRVELSVTSIVPLPGMSKDAIAAAIQLERDMSARDDEIHATHDMRNSLETYIYNMRDALYGDLDAYASSDEKERLNAALGDAESWLYDNMEADKGTFAKKLAELRQIGDPVSARKYENENRSFAGEQLVQAVEEFRAVINNRDGKHAHLSDSDRDIMRAACSEAESWYFNLREQQAGLDLARDPVLKVADINARRDTLNRELRPIANKKPPAPAPAPTPAAAPAPAAAEGSDQKKEDAPPAPAAEGADGKMDVE